MKVIKYQYLADGIVYGAEVEYNEENEAIVKAEAYNGEYEIYDDGQPASGEETDEDVWNELDAAYQEGVDSV